MLLKINFIHSPLSVFPENLIVVSEEQAESDTKTKMMQFRFQGRWDAVIIDYYCGF